MAGDPPIYDCHDATCITRLISTSEPFRTISSNSYYIGQYVHKQVPNKSKKEMIKERAEQIHKLSFLMVNEIRPKVLQVIGYPMKNKPKPYHKNYALH